MVPRKGGKVVTIPLAPSTARAIDLALGERVDGPTFVGRDGGRLDRHAGWRIVRRLARMAGINKPVTHATPGAAVTARAAAWAHEGRWTHALSIPSRGRRPCGRQPDLAGDGSYASVAASRCRSSAAFSDATGSAWRWTTFHSPSSRRNTVVARSV